MLGILGEGDRTHCSRPADIHQIEVFLLLLYYYFYSLLKLNLTTFFNTLVFFLTEKTFQRQPEALFPSCLRFSDYPEMEPRRLAA
jgi:hypothetical protein